MRSILKTTICGILIFIASAGYFPTFAQESAFKVDYNFEFYAQNDSPDLDVDLDIILTNVRSDVYITEYSMRFPRNFFFKNLSVTREGQDIPFVVSEEDSMKLLTFKFDEPDSGAFSKNRLQLHYTLQDMHSHAGRINEIIMPLLISDEKSTVNVTLHLPEDFDKTISVAKPVPSALDFRQIHWNNVKTRTIFALFGESQVYDVSLGYSLKNTGLRDSVQTIALPPETLYQRVFIDTLDPKPDRTFTDEDGNFLAEYSIPSRSSLDIQFKGYVQIFIKPQSELRDYMRKAFARQKSFLLTEKPLWALEDFVQSKKIQEIHSPEELFHFVVDTLDYSVARLQEATTEPRYGAAKALSNPTTAICTEYTDVFIALAREKGIPAREIEGYGYSASRRIRPQSLVLDELHAWPEYYDEQQEVWMQIDPTWADTSGIDYFSGFDSNHIALAIHGKESDKPLPAGFYKTAARKDVDIKISSIKPSARILVDVSSDIDTSLTVGKAYTSQVSITNTGNAFIHEMKVIPEADHILFTTGPIHVSYLAPYETKTYAVSYAVQENYTPLDTISFTYDGSVLGSYDVRVADREQFSLKRVILIFASVLTGGMVLYFVFRTKRT